MTEIFPIVCCITLNGHPGRALHQSASTLEAGLVASKHHRRRPSRRYQSPASRTPARRRRRIVDAVGAGGPRGEVDAGRVLEADEREQLGARKSSVASSTMTVLGSACMAVERLPASRTSGANLTDRFHHDAQFPDGHAAPVYQEHGERERRSPRWRSARSYGERRSTKVMTVPSGSTVTLSTLGRIVRSSLCAGFSITTVVRSEWRLCHVPWP